MEELIALQNLGLNEKEAKIYLALLKLGESTSVQIAKEIDVHRRTIYDNLNILIRKGLVGYKIKKGVKYFNASNPTSFKIFLEEKQNILKNLLPSLIERYKEKIIPPIFNIYTGKEAVKTILEDVIQQKKPACWVGGGLFFFDTLGFSKKFIKEKLSRIKIKMIQAKSKDINDRLKDSLLKNVKLLPPEYVSKTGYFVYADRVAIGAIQDNQIIVIHIIDKEFAKGFRNYFNLLWKIAK